MNEPFVVCQERTELDDKSFINQTVRLQFCHPERGLLYSLFSSLKMIYTLVKDEVIQIQLLIVWPQPDIACFFVP